MIKTLISLNADLASSIAFRYCCRLTEFVDMKLQAIHVEEPEGSPPGSGWVQSTWEEGLRHTAKEEISQLIKTEKSSCPRLDAPIIRIGEREDEVLHEIKEESYDLFIEGVLNSFNAVNFNKKVRSKLYTHAPCPIILVKNLVGLKSVALLLSDETDLKPLILTFLKIFRKSELAIDLVCFTFQKSGRAGVMKKIEASSAPGQENANKMFGAARTMLAGNGWERKENWIVKDTPKRIGDFLVDYSLVAACIPRNAEKRNRVMELLSRVPSAILLCRK
jgi:hypothetical protein